jgi:pyridoxamine 5'-phosphate oxidase family protein
MTDGVTPAELAYLHSQRLGRLASVDSDGAPQNNPVGFFVDDGTGDVLIGGTQLGASRKFRNVRRNPNVALVVDDLASVGSDGARPLPRKTSIRRCGG